MEYCLADVGILRNKRMGSIVLDETFKGQLFKYNRESYQQVNESLDIKSFLRGWSAKGNLND